MEKANITLQELLTLLGTTEFIEVKTYDQVDPLYRGKAAKLKRDEGNPSTKKKVRFISCEVAIDAPNGFTLIVWVY